MFVRTSILCTRTSNGVDAKTQTEENPLKSCNVSVHVEEEFTTEVKKEVFLQMIHIFVNSAIFDSLTSNQVNNLNFVMKVENEQTH